MDIIIATMTFRFIMCLVRSFLFLLHCSLIVVGYMESSYFCFNEVHCSLIVGYMDSAGGAMFDLV